MLRNISRSKSRVSFATKRWMSALPNVHKTQLFIDGKFVDSKASEWFTVYSPATQEPVTQVPLATQEEMQAAVDSAQRAFSEWRHVPVSARQRHVFKLLHLMNEAKDEIAENIVQENGKTLADAHGDVFRGIEVCETATQVSMRMLGDTMEQVGRSIDSYSYYQPLGVCAGIAPFNFPFMIPAWMAPLAAACGNTFVMKPSERTPGATMIMARLFKEAGFPDGTLNVIHGTKDCVNFICDSPTIKTISFVGSNQAGEYIHQRGTSTNKRVQSNMGAKNHCVVLPDANKESCINQIAGAAFGAAGQRCMALSVAIFVGDAKQWVPELVEKAKTLKTGPGVDPATDVGPMITPEAKERAEGLIQSAIDQGATVLLDGRKPSVPGYPKGNFLSPTLITEVGTEMDCYREEIFGPVLSCIFVDSLDDALTLINANPYGNGTSLFTRSGAAARKFQYEVDVGQVGINVPIPVPLPMFGWSGSRDSYRGGHRFYGKEGVQFFTQPKTITTSWKYDEETEKLATSFPLL